MWRLVAVAFLAACSAPSEPAGDHVDVALPPARPASPAPPVPVADAPPPPPPSQAAPQPTADPSSQAREDARQLFLEGVEAYASADYTKARERFEAAHRLVPNPNILYNIAQAFASEGNKQKACETFREYVQQAGSTLQQSRLQQIQQTCP